MLRECIMAIVCDKIRFDTSDYMVARKSREAVEGRTRAQALSKSLYHMC